MPRQRPRRRLGLRRRRGDPAPVRHRLLRRFHLPRRARREPSPAIVNQIYWPVGDLARKRAYERGERARVGEVRRDRILLVEGPLALATRAEKIPVRIENSAITAKEPGTKRRIATWVEQNIHVQGRPEWVFVKVHTHGAPEPRGRPLLGEGGRTMHRAAPHSPLQRRAATGSSAYVKEGHRREMFNIAIAAMEGLEGNPFAYKDHVLAPPGVAS